MKYAIGKLQYLVQFIFWQQLLFTILFFIPHTIHKFLLKFFIIGSADRNL